MTQFLFEGSSKIFRQEKEQVLMIFKDTIHGAQRESNIAGTGHLRQAFTYHFYHLLDRRFIDS